VTEAISSISFFDNPYSEVFVIGSRSGEVIILSKSDEEWLVPYAENFGSTSANVSLADGHGFTSSILVTCNSTLVLLGNFDAEARTFRDKTRIWPVDASDLKAPSPAIDFAAVSAEKLSDKGRSLVILSGSRILLAEMQDRPGPVPRHLPVEGTPLRVIYSHFLQCLVLAVNKGDKPTLMFIDIESGEDLGKPTDKNGEVLEFISGLGKSGDRIYGLAEWEYQKENSVWRFILVSTRDGRLMVVSTEKEAAPAAGGRTMVRYWTRWKSDFERPIYSVLGTANGIIFCVGQTIHWEVLDQDEKKLKPMKKFDLGSPTTALQIGVNDKLLALTNRDSLEVIDYQSNDGGPDTMSLLHVDPQRRHTVHMIEMAGKSPDSHGDAITLLCDRDCGITGVWIPRETPGRDLQVVFEAELPASIRKFRRGRIRPQWEQAGYSPRYGREVSTFDDADVFGICIDGSLHHFTLLHIEIWRVLRFIQNLALTSPILYPFTYEAVDDICGFDPEPKEDQSFEMQVDGDMLRRCLEKRALGGLISQPSHVSRFKELLDDLENGQHTAEFRMDGDGVDGQYFGLAYEILEYFLAPVL
jgi:hypothetical protein